MYLYSYHIQDSRFFGFNGIKNTQFFGNLPKLEHVIIHDKECVVLIKSFMTF